MYWLAKKERIMRMASDFWARMKEILSPERSPSRRGRQAGSLQKAVIEALEPRLMLTSVLSISRQTGSSNPTNGTNINYTVTFNTSVTGVDAADFSLSLSGITGASVTGVSGSGATRTITVGTGTGDGTIGL